jgi:flagellar biosynthesis regulator FlaF
MRHRQKVYWTCIPEIQFSSWPKFVSLLQRPQNSIERQVRNSIILTFTSFSITQLEKPAFYLHARPTGARMRQRQKVYGPCIAEIQFSSWPKFVSLLQRPQNSIERQVRNSIILTFTSFSITQLEKPAFYLHGRPSGARRRHRQNAYGPWIIEIQFSSWPKFVSLLQRP